MPAPYEDSPVDGSSSRPHNGHTEMSWAPTPDMANPFGSVHGGIIATAIDESCGAALMPLIETPSAPTVSLNVEYLHAVQIGGTYRVLSEIVRKGRAMAIADAPRAWTRTARCSSGAPATSRSPPKPNVEVGQRATRRSEAASPTVDSRETLVSDRSMGRAGRAW